MSAGLVLPTSIEVTQPSPVADIMLKADLTIGLYPAPAWVAENPTLDPGKCPKEFLVVRIGIIGTEVHPLVTVENPNEWPRVTIPVGTLVTVPWKSWRKEMDKKFLPVAESDG